MPDKISYLNSSGEAIPPFAVLQFESDVDFNSTTKAQTVKAYKPDGTGPYAIDDGKGADAANEGRYGQCLVPLQHTFWAYYTGAAAPGTAWTTEVGPVTGQWYMDATGAGYWYAGSFDPDNQRILVQQKAAGAGGPIVHFAIATPDCDNSSALATVLARTHGTNSPAIGDTIQVCDIAGCFFGASNTLLNGRKGFAQQMTGVSCLPQSGTGTGTGSAITNPWVVFSLCSSDVSC